MTLRTAGAPARRRVSEPGSRPYPARRGWVPAFPPVATGPVLPAGPVATFCLAPGPPPPPTPVTALGSVASEPPPGPEDALADVIPAREHRDGSAVGAPARRARRARPSVLVAVLRVAAAEWTWWLHPGGVLEAAVAAGGRRRCSASLLLLAPRRWPAPGRRGRARGRHRRGARTTPRPSSSSAARWRPSPPRLATALLLRWYAAGAFRLARASGAVRAGRRAPRSAASSAPRSRRSRRAIAHDLERRRALARRVADRGRDRRSAWCWSARPC